MKRDTRAPKRIALAVAAVTALLLAQAITIWSLIGSSRQLMVDAWTTGHQGTKLALEIKLDVVQVQQWLQDISATRAAKDFDDGFDEADKYAKLFRKNVAALGAMHPEMQPALQDLSATFETYYEKGQWMAKEYVAGGPERGNLGMAQFDSIAEQMATSANLLIQQIDAQANEQMATAVTRTSASQNLALGSSAAVIALVLFVAFRVSSLMVKLSSTSQRLEQTLSEVDGASVKVSSAASQVSTDSLTVAQGAAEQAASILSITALLVEIATSTRQNGIDAKQAKTISEDSQVSASKTMRAMDHMSAAIDKISLSSKQTAKIVKTSEQLAFQTNLLAINASIQAARAGDAGKAFGVVAEEVRRLAERSADAAKMTSELIEQAERSAAEGALVTSQVASSLQEIVGGSRKVNDLVVAIATVAEQQSTSIVQISDATSQLDRVTQQNAVHAEESASTAEELNSRAAELGSIVGSFSLNA